MCVCVCQGQMEQARMWVAQSEAKKQKYILKKKKKNLCRGDDVCHLPFLILSSYLLSYFFILIPVISLIPLVTFQLCLFFCPYLCKELPAVI